MSSKVFLLDNQRIFALWKFKQSNKNYKFAKQKCLHIICDNLNMDDLLNVTLSSKLFCTRGYVDDSCEILKKSENSI